MTEIALRLHAVLQKIESAALRCERDPGTIRLLAVSKSFPACLVDSAALAGQVLFGENRVQEAEQKLPQVTARGLHWHLIGHLQSNKARKAVRLFDTIETLDSPRILRRVAVVAEELGKVLPVFLQVNVGGESHKSGVEPEQLPAMVELADSFPSLDLQGLMAIPPYCEDPEGSRPYFRRLRQLLDQVNAGRSRTLKELSMGMSHDFSVAVQEGSTLVRVGTAVFGSRG